MASSRVTGIVVPGEALIDGGCLFVDACFGMVSANAAQLANRSPDRARIILNHVPCFHNNRSAEVK
jgi:hypothetical protein